MASQEGVNRDVPLARELQLALFDSSVLPIGACVTLFCLDPFQACVMQFVAKFIEPPEKTL